jgi:nucleosome-remodeling factor subunit BPTF
VKCESWEFNRTFFCAFQLSGVIDCASELEKAGLLIRHDKLGYDRHGRKYWFLVRRLLV